MPINKRRTTVVVPGGRVPGKVDKTISQPKPDAPREAPAGTLCAYPGAPHGGTLWQCRTCHRWFCVVHWTVNKEGEKNVECSSCDHERQQRR